MSIYTDQMYARNTYYPVKILCPFLNEMDETEKNVLYEEECQIKQILPKYLSQDRILNGFLGGTIGGAIGT
jgi:hypothetical protein